MNKYLLIFLMKIVMLRDEMLNILTLVKFVPEVRRMNCIPNQVKEYLAFQKQSFIKINLDLHVFFDFN